VIRELFCSEHKKSYRTCLGEFTEFILDVRQRRLVSRDLQHISPGSRLEAERDFLYSCSISTETLFSYCLSSDYHPVDLLHCSFPLMHSMPSLCHLLLTSQHLPNNTNASPRRISVAWLPLMVCLIIQVYLLHQKRITELTLFQTYLLVYMLFVNFY